MAVVIETTLGDITIDLFVDERPTTCMNFLKLCKIKYYNFCLFHSVQQNFIAQSGDPSGSGHEGSSIFFHTRGNDAKYYEAEKVPKIKHSNIGTVSMVNCGNHMFGSQFFITLGKDLQSLDGEHCVFGEVAEGHEVLRKFNEVICDQEHRPYQDIRITHTVVLEDPFDDPPGLQVPESSPELTKEALANSRIAADEEIDETAGLTAEEVEELQRSREAKAQATILEIVGDLPDAEVAPPENVLFVCKLNPVTTDDDLEIIFSRFGKIVSCEVIRDKTTGDSLQYAFVEFENRKACEDAYFKMDNVLIDDRRIHVDFSQSVSKLRWKGKGRGVEHLDDGKPMPDFANYDKKSCNYTKRSPDNSRSRYTDGDSYSNRRNYHFNQRDSVERRSRKRTSRENSPQNMASRERRRKSDHSNETYHRPYDNDNSFMRHRHYKENSDNLERSKYESQRDNNFKRTKRNHNERYYYKNDRKEVSQNKEEKHRRKSPESDSDSDDYREHTRREKYDYHKYRKGSVDSENEVKKHDHTKRDRQEHNSPCSDTDYEKVKTRKDSKQSRKKDRSDSIDSGNDRVTATPRGNKSQKTKHKVDPVVSTDENTQHRRGEKCDREKIRDNNSDSESETTHRKRYERRKGSVHGCGSDEERGSSHREEKRKQSTELGLVKKSSSTRDEKEGKRKEKMKDCDSDIDKPRHKNEKQRNTLKKADYISDSEIVSKRKKLTKTNKNKNIEKNSRKSKNKVVQRKGKKKRRRRLKKHESSSSSDTSESSSSSDSDSDTSTSSTSSSSSSDSDNSSNSSSSSSTSSSSSSSSSSCTSSSSDNSHYNRKHHKRRKKPAKVNIVVKKARKKTVPTKKPKKEFIRLSESSGAENRKSKEKGQKRKVASTHSRNGDDANKNSKTKSRSKKRKVSSSVDSSEDSNSSNSSEESQKERKHHKRTMKK